MTMIISRDQILSGWTAYRVDMLAEEFEYPADAEGDTGEWYFSEYLHSVLEWIKLQGQEEHFTARICEYMNLRIGA